MFYTFMYNVCINRYKVLAQYRQYYRYIIIQNLCGTRIPLFKKNQFNSTLKDRHKIVFFQPTNYFFNKLKHNNHL